MIMNNLANCFCLTDDQVSKANQFIKEQDALYIKGILDNPGKYEEYFVEYASKGEAYYGAIGGAYSYTFIATDIGNFVSIKHDVSGTSLNLTDYDSF